MPILVLLLVVVVAWIGLSVYFQQTSININPNASTYIVNIRNTFDRNSYDEMIKKTKENLLISPDTFLNIKPN